MTVIANYFEPGKAPVDTLPFTCDFGNLIPRGETIVSATVSALPSGLTCSSPSIVKNTVISYISGGSLGTVYTVHFVVNTQNEVIDRVGLLPCQQI